LGRLRREAFGRETGGEVLSPLDLLRMAALVDFLTRSGAAGGLGASLGGFAVGFLRSLSQPAARTESHSAAASPGEVSVVHISSSFGRRTRFATSPGRSTSRALKTRRKITAAVECP